MTLDQITFAVGRVAAGMGISTDDAGSAERLAFDQKTIIPVRLAHSAIARVARRRWAELDDRKLRFAETETAFGAICAALTETRDTLRGDVIGTWLLDRDGGVRIDAEINDGTKPSDDEVSKRALDISQRLVDVLLDMATRYPEVRQRLDEYGVQMMEATK